MKRMTSALTMVLLVGIAFAVSASTFLDAQAQTPAHATPAPHAPPAPVVIDTNHGTALLLLDRVATLLDAAVSGKSSKTGAVGTSGYSESLGKVVMDRVALRPREKPEAAR